jgi:hypothetical protein
VRSLLSCEVSLRDAASAVRCPLRYCRSASAGSRVSVEGDIEIEREERTKINISACGSIWVRHLGVCVCVCVYVCVCVCVCAFVFVVLMWMVAHVRR